MGTRQTDGGRRIVVNDDAVWGPKREAGTNKNDGLYTCNTCEM